MAIDYEKLKNRPFDPVEQTYTTNQAILYALGLGFGAEPFDEDHLHFTFEEEGFSAVPTMAVVLAGPGFWVRQPDSLSLIHISEPTRLRRKSRMPSSA